MAKRWSDVIGWRVRRAAGLAAFFDLGSGGFHLQRSHLINNAQPGPGLIQPRRPFPKISFVPNSTFPSNVTVAGTTFPVSTMNLLENTAQS